MIQCPLPSSEPSLRSLRGSAERSPSASGSWISAKDLGARLPRPRHREGYPPNAIARLSSPRHALCEEGRAIVDPAVKAAKAGDWRAGFALMERVYGKPTERVEMEQKRAEDLSASELDAAIARILQDADTPNA